MHSGGDADVLEDGSSFDDGAVVDDDAGIVSFRVDYAVGIGLRCQHIAVERRGPIFAAGRVKLENGDDFAGIGRFDKIDRKSTRLNSSHTVISYAVFCLKK